MCNVWGALSRLGKTLHLRDLNTESSHVCSLEHVIRIFCIFPRGSSSQRQKYPHLLFFMSRQEGVNYSCHLQPY